MKKKKPKYIHIHTHAGHIRCISRNTRKFLYFRKEEKTLKIWRIKSKTPTKISEKKTKKNLRTLRNGLKLEHQQKLQTNTYTHTHITYTQTLS